MANEFKVKNGLIVSGSADFEQDLRVRGTLTVDELHTSITTSSVIFESGSTAFGNSIDDTHTLTGSVNITGSITLNGQAIGTGKLDETTFNTYTASYKVATTDFNSLTNSYNSFTTSYISNSSSFNSRVGSLESFSSSLDISFVNEVEFGTFSGSIKNFTASLNNYTNSLENRLSVIDSTTSSLNTFTSSANGRLNSIESATASLYSFSSSVNNRLSTVETSTGSLNTFSSSTNTRLSSIETSTSSLNSYSSSNNIRLGIIETTTSSLNSFTSSINTTIKNKLNDDGVISGSIQILNGSNIVSSSAQVTTYGFAITGSNLFKGTQTLSGSIIPAVDNAYDLGSPTYQWRDVYISSGSLYVDGTKVLSSTAQELLITTDNGQSIKILEGGTDSIILQTADGDIELKSNADGDILLDPTNGKIMLKGTVEILNGNKIQSSVGGTPVVFANDIVVSGSIDITGTIEGINLTDFSSSINTRVSNLETSAGSLNSFTSSTNTRLSAIETSTSSINTFTSSTNTKLGVIETSTASLNSYTSSNNTRLGVIETTTGSLNTFTSSTNTRLSNLETSSGSLNSFTSSAGGRLISIETSTSSLNTFTSSINTTIKNRLNTEGVISGSVQINITDTTGYSTFSSSISSSAGALSSSIATTTNNLSTSVATYNLGQDNRLSSIEGKTGSYATTGSNIFIGNQVITGSIFVSQDLIIAGSSSIQHISSSVVNIADNIITVNAQNPSIRFGGLAVIDSGSLPQVSGSMLFDSTNDQWIFVHQNQATVTSSVLLMGPQTYNNLGNETYPTTNKVLKSVNAEHVGDSNISDNGTTVSINSNTEITGGLVVTGTVSATNITTIQSSVNSLNSYTSSNTTNINAIQTATASLNSYTSSTNTRLGVIETTTGSLNTFTSSASSRLSSLETASGSIRSDFNSYTSSNNGRVGAIETSTSSLNTFTSSINTTIKNRLNAEGVLSGSSQVTFGSISGVPSGLISGSSQVSYGGLSGIPSGIVSGSSQVSYPNLSNIPSGIVSGSSQITYGSVSGIPGGIVSGSVQIDLTATTNYSSGIKSRLNAENVLSSSAQVVSALPAGTVSGSSQVLVGTTIHSGSFFNGITVVSGSGQISFGGITGVPSGLVSGSSQITFGSISSIPSGLVSGSAQLTAFVLKSGDTMTGALTISTSTSPGLNISKDASTDNRYLRLTNTQASSKTWDLINQTNANNNEFVVYNHTDNLNALRISTAGAGTFASSVTAAGITSSAGLTVSGTAYYTFNKPSTTNYQTVALFGTTANGIFITSDSGIISRGAFFNGGWQATSTTGAYLNFNTSGGGMDLNVFSGGTAGGAVSFTTLFTVARDNFSFNSNAILHAGNYSSYAVPLGGGTMTGLLSVGYSRTDEPFVQSHFYNTSTTSGTQYGGTLVSGINQAHIRFQVGTNTWGASGAKQWQIRVGNGSGEDNMKIYSWTYGNDVLTISSNATATFAGNLSAANLSGTNTGDQTNISGNAATATLASNSSGLEGLTINQIFNNRGRNHGSPTDFDLVSVFGPYFIQGTTNGPGTGSSQFYGISLGLGNEYAYSQYAMQMAIPRYNSTDRYISYRTRENTTWGSWNKIWAGYADSAGSAGTATSATTAGNITAYTINQNLGTTNSPTFGALTLSGAINSSGNATFRNDGNSGFSIRVDGVNSSTDNDIRFAKGGVDYGAIQTAAGSPHDFEFYVNNGTTWSRMFYMKRDASGSVFDTGSLTVNGVYKLGGGNAYFTGNATHGYRFNNEADTLNLFTINNNGVLNVHQAVTVDAPTANMKISANGIIFGGANSGKETNSAQISVGYHQVNSLNIVGMSSSSGSSDRRVDMWVEGGLHTLGSIIPKANSTYNLGSSSSRWNTVFTSDLSMSNGIGDYTIVEGEEDLFIYNNKTNKVFKFLLQEVDPSIAPAKKVH